VDLWWAKFQYVRVRAKINNFINTAPVVEQAAQTNNGAICAFSESFFYPNEFDLLTICCIFYSLIINLYALKRILKLNPLRNYN
jgi:hypothetical protein